MITGKFFGKDYEWAVNWLKQNDKIFTAYSNKYNVPARELKAIIFPELIRYNRVFDAIQIESLKYLYVTEGKYYADFSVGFFQMKPSFAEKVEREAEPVFGYKELEDNEQNRRDRLLRLTKNCNPGKLPVCVLQALRKNFSSSEPSPAPDKIKLFATAYNAGYHLRLDKLRSYNQEALQRL